MNKTIKNLLLAIFVFLQSCATGENTDCISVTGAPMPTIRPATPTITLTKPSATPTEDHSEILQKIQWASDINELWDSSCSIYDLSSDGQWCVNDMGPDIEVYGRDGVTKHAFEKDIRSLCAWFLRVFWSPDGKYLYFAPGNCSHNKNIDDGIAPALYRLALATGEIVDILPITSNPEPASLAERGFYDFEFSSDGLYLAYLQSYRTPIVVTIKNLASDEDIEFVLDAAYPEAGCISWAPNSHFVAFNAATTTRPGYDATASLYMADVDKAEIHEILRAERFVYCPITRTYQGKDLIGIRQTDLVNYLNPLCSSDNPDCITDWYLDPHTLELWPE